MERGQGEVQGGSSNCILHENSKPGKHEKQFLRAFVVLCFRVKQFSCQNLGGKWKVERCLYQAAGFATLTDDHNAIPTISRFATMTGPECNRKP
jgi:hypothetical protein